MRIREGNFLSSDLPELEFVPGANVSIVGAESNKGVQITISSAGGGGGSTGLVLVPTSLKVVNYSAAASDFVPVATTSGNVTVSLPAAPADGTVVGVKMVAQVSANTVTVAAGGSDTFNTTGGPTSLSIAQLNQGVIVQYQVANAIWYVIVDDATVRALDSFGPTTDVTTNNVTAVKHGFVPKTPGDAAQFLNGAATGAYAQVKDSDLSTSDVTSNNATTGKHGFVPKLPGGTTSFYRADGTFATPAGTGGVATDTIWNAKGDVVGGTGADTAAITTLGTNGQVLTVNTGSANGLSWATPAAVGIGGTPWSTSLKNAVSSSATTATMNDAVPLALATSTRLFAIIEPWTTNAEMVACTVDVTGKVYTFGAIAHSHTSGVTVLVLDGNTVHPEWWGALADTSASAGTNVTAFGNMLTQLGAAGYSNPSTYEFQIVGACGNSSRGISKRYYPINSKITLFSGFSSIGNCTFLTTSDFGSGQYALDAGGLTNGIRVHDCQVISSNASMSMASFLSGGSAPPVAMDGFHFTERCIVERCVANGFRSGFLLDFVDHSKFTDCHAGNNMFGYAFQHAGQDGGDMSFTKCDSDGSYRASWGLLASGHGPSGVSWRDCSWTNSPFIFFGQGGFQILDGTMVNCNSEFAGNGFCYSTSGMIFWCNIIAPATPVIYATGGTWVDPNFPSAAAIQAASGVLSVRDAAMTANYPGGAGYVFDNPTGTVTFSNSEIRTDTSGGPSGLVKTGGQTSYSGRLIVGANRATGRACVNTTGSINANDLVEGVGTAGGVQQYQTPGAVPAGVAYWAPTGGATSVLDDGFCLVNCGTNTVAANKIVVPDITQPGCVIQSDLAPAASYYATVTADSPVGFWKLAETAFGSAAVDETGNQNGVYTNTSGLVFKQDGIKGGANTQAVKFIAASAGYVAIADAAGQHIGDTGSWECWVKRASTGANATLMSGIASTSFQLYFSSGDNAVYLGQITAGANVKSTTTIPADGVWHHIVATKNGSTAIMYVDGVAGTNLFTNHTFANSNTITLAANGSGLDGSMAMAAIYPTALSAARVAAHYQAGAALLPGRTVGRTVSASSSNSVRIKLLV